MQRCKVCALDPTVLAEIESSVAAGMSTREVASTFNVSQSSLVRHRKHHPTGTLTVLTSVRAPATPGEEDELVASTWETLQAAKQHGDLSQIAGAHVQYRLARADKHERDLAAELLELKRKPPVGIDIQASEEWTANRTLTFKLLEAHDRRHGHGGADSIRRELADALGMSDSPLDVDMARALDASKLGSLLGKEPGDVADPWQLDVLASRHPQVLLMAYRGAGKSSVAALLALHCAIYTPGSTTLIISVLRQSQEVFRKVMTAYYQMEKPVKLKVENQLSMELENRSRIICLPGNAETIRGHHAELVIVDEAAGIEDDILPSVLPMLAATAGRLVILSTPRGRRGFFYELWEHGSDDWERVSIPVDSPRARGIDPEKLESDRRAMGEREFREEYFLEFREDEGAAFNDADLQRALKNELEPYLKVRWS